MLKMDDSERLQATLLTVFNPIFTCTVKENLRLQTGKNILYRNMLNIAKII